MATLIFKATEACNANCVYCDVVHLRRPRTISDELLRLVYSRIDEYLRAEPGERVLVTWHGGEPCMAGVELYRKALEYAEEYCADTRQRIDYCIQSNLTLINDEFLDVFSRMGINSLGTSYESEPGVRGIGPQRDSRLYDRLFFRGVNLLEKRGFSWGFIYVVTRAVIHKPLEVFYHLTNLKPDGDFDFHIVVSSDENSAEESCRTVVTQQEYADFLGKIFEEWWPRRERFPKVRPFASLLRLYQGVNEDLSCNDAPDCGSHLYIGPDGETAQCGRAADWGVLTYGNLRDCSLQEIFALPERKRLDRRAEQLRGGECGDCEYWRICHGGCPLDAYNAHKEFGRRTDQCESRRIFLRKYFEPITGLKLP